MSFLDEQKRARRATKPLVRLLTKQGRFEDDLDAYTAADGIIDDDFLARLESARTLLKTVDEPSFLGELEALPVAFQEAFLEYLRQQSRFDRLAAIAETSRFKALVKSAKQILHAARTSGDFKPESRSASWKLAASAAPAEMICAATAYDPNGDRIILIAKETAGGPRLLQVIENDRKGVTQHVSGTQNRSKYKALLKGVQEIGVDHYREVTIAEGLWLIDRAHRRHRRDGTEPPAGFLTALSFFTEKNALPERHPFYGCVKPLELEHQETQATRSASLFEDPLTRGWSIGATEFRRFQHRIGEFIHTREELLEPANRRRVADLIDETVSAVFTDKVRQAFADRLMDMAWFAAESRRPNALLAYATALALNNGSRDALSIPFCRRLLSRFVPGQDEAPTAAPAPSIIIP